jgi:hypothetical protein
MEFVIPAVLIVVIGLAFLVVHQRRSPGRPTTPRGAPAPSEQTSTSTVPPTEPNAPVPGSRTRREQQGKP